MGFLCKIESSQSNYFSLHPLEKPTFNLAQVRIAQNWSRFINKNARCLYVFTSYLPFEGSMWNPIPVGKVHPHAGSKDWEYMLEVMGLANLSLPTSF